MADVLVPLAQGFEEIEAVTVIDVLRRAEVAVVAAAVAGREVTGSRGVVLRADTELAAVSDHEFDLVYLPGGLEGMERLASDPRIGDLLRRHLAGGGKVAAICASTYVLHAHGVLGKDARITSHPSVAEDLAAYRYVEDRVVVDGPIITSRGPGTAMELALALAESMTDPAVREDLESAMLVRGESS